MNRVSDTLECPFTLQIFTGDSLNELRMKDILNKEAGRKSLENAKQGKLMVVGRKTVDRGHIDRILIDNR